MKKIGLPFLLFAAIQSGAQNVGINTNAPMAPLHINSAGGVELLRLQGVTPYISFYNQPNTYSGYLWGKATGMELGTPLGSGLPVIVAPGRFANTTFTADGNVGIGIPNPGYKLEVNGRMRLLHGTETAGIWFNNTSNTATTSFVGIFDDNTYGFYGSSIGWSMLLNANNGNIGLGALPDLNARLSVVGTNAGIYVRSANTSTTAVKIGTGKLVSEGAGIGSPTTVFVHKATVANASNAAGDHLGYTVIDNPYCNNNPTAILMVTLNGTYGTGTNLGYERIPEQGYGSSQIITVTSCMVFYNGPNSDFYFTGPVYARNRWCIRTYNRDYVADPIPFNFNVMVFQPG